MAESGGKMLKIFRRLTGKKSPNRRNESTPSSGGECDRATSTPPTKRQVCISDSPASAKRAFGNQAKQVTIHTGNGRVVRLEGNGDYSSSEDLTIKTHSEKQPEVVNSDSCDKLVANDKPNRTKIPGDTCTQYYTPVLPEGKSEPSKRQSMYQMPTTSHDLTGRASLSARDLIFGIPPPPSLPPRMAKDRLRKSFSTPNIHKKSSKNHKNERKPRSKTGVSRDLVTPTFSSEADLATIPYKPDQGLSVPSPAGSEGPGPSLDVSRQAVNPADVSRLSMGPSEATDSDTEPDSEASQYWSDDDDTSQGSGCSPGGDDTYENLRFEPPPADGRQAHLVAKELMVSEGEYVKKLAILNKARDNTKDVLGYDLAKEIFPYINSMYTLHKDHMLPRLQERLKKWDSQQQIGDIMKMFAPYLKVYTDYVKNFDNALKLVDSWNSKSPEFSKMLKKLPSNGPSLNLKVQIKSHMLQPIQRVPRYKLLLTQYAKEIPENSPERADLQVALTSVSQAAAHFEEMMKHGTSMVTLMELQRHIDCPVGLMTTGRELVRQGRIGKVHATTGRVVSRFLFLFNDLFLVCSEQTFHIPGIQPKYKCRQLMEIEGMQVTSGDNLEVPYTFYVKTRKKAIELCASSEEERTDWEELLWKVIGEKMRQKITKNTINRRRTMMLRADGPLGKEAPVWVHNTQVTMCMACGNEFRGLRKKHHCRACGSVVCHRCSSRTQKLEYDDFRDRRVCDECYLVLEGQVVTSRRESIYKARSRQICTQKGYLQASTDRGRTWQRRWFEVHEGGSLYCYKAQQDISPISHISGAIPEVTSVNGIKMILLNFGQDKVYLLKEESDQKLHSWLEALVGHSS